MEGGHQSSKRRRVYSPQPKKVAQAMFTRNYVNYLVPSLMKIKESSTSSGIRSYGDNKHCDFHNVVKHEVDMAMVFSAQGYAWSDALKVKLLRAHHNHNNDNSSTTSFVENDDKGSSSRIYPSSKSKVLVNKSNNKCIDMEEKERVLKGEDNNEEDEEEEVIIKKQLKCLRKLIPGGEEMCNDEQMVSELESYIRCLQMQVNILQCITQTP